MFTIRRTVRRIYQQKYAIMGIIYTNGINVTIRRSLGNDIQGACGQLRKNYIDKLKSQ